MEEEKGIPVLADGIQVSREAFIRMIEALNELTGAIRELSWVLAKQWAWEPVEDKKNPPTGTT